MLLRDEVAAGLDPVLFARRCGLEPYGWQLDVLRSGASRLLLNCCRQSGKSTIVSLMALHTAIYTPDALVLIRSPSMEQSQETFRKTMGFYRALGRPVPAEAENTQRLALENGSRIVSMSGVERTTRGFSAPTLLIVDEASRVEDDVFFSDLPLLASGNGRLIALSTPRGSRGWWYEVWRTGEEWDRVFVPWDRSRLDQAEVERQRRIMAPWYFEQEYLCVFNDAETQAFSADDIQACFGVVETWDDLLGPAWAA